jgi:2-polyprenyl-3-methyl-5-hydroxy-6-metoxy-1,4-benzoquinol methylase
MGAGGQKAYLVPVILDSIEAMTERLRAGATVVDIGCGAGVAATTVAQAFPNTTVIGVDPSSHAIAAASARAAEAGLDNLSFRQGTFDDLGEFADVDLLLTLDVIHDLPRPGAAVRSARGCLADDGVWMVADIRARGGLEDNRAIPVLPLMYGMSILYCMSSAMSEPGGAGLGTLGLTTGVFEEMTQAAGFTGFVSREFDVDVMNRYYEVRP